MVGAADGAWRVNAVQLPDGEGPQDRWLTAAGWSERPVPGAELLPGGFALPGLVDAHTHASFGPSRNGPRPLARDDAERQRERWAADGVALARDMGGDPSVVLELTGSRGRSAIVATGRHLAPAGMYFNAVHLPVPADRAVEVAEGELAAGARWVKLVADFAPGRSQNASSTDEPTQTYDLEVVQRLVEATHSAGGRLAAHVTTALVADLVRLGIDSVEHGYALDEETVAEMGRRGTAWTPTLCASLSPGRSSDDDRQKLIESRRDRLRTLLPLAVRSRVPVLTGSDVVGSIPREVALLFECGLDPGDALRAATTTALDYLDSDLVERPAAVVTYEADPRNDPVTLARPAAVVIGGVRVL